jgi:hypothetical protein
LGGRTTDLVKDASTGVWRALDDTNARITVGVGAGNGDDDGEYWLVTTDDGTKYYFGTEKRGPGDTGSSGAT